MQVFRRWRNDAAPIGFVPAAYEDREAMFHSRAGNVLRFLLTLWALGEQGFCFCAKNGVLNIGLVKVAKRAKASHRRPRRTSRR